MKDNIYTDEQNIVDFTFDEKVVSVFPDMINRSVPGYPTIIKMIGSLAERYVQPNTRCYDLGCSLGASTFAMRHHVPKDSVQIISVDNSQAMLDQFQQAITLDNEHRGEGAMVISRLADIAEVDIVNASMVVLNFTLQFIPVAQRDAMIQKVYAGLVDGGVLVLSEKLVFDDEHMNELYIDLHHNFKKSQGYSELEIAQKRSAIENVLVPETMARHKDRFASAGFASSDVWFQCMNFASFVAIK